MKHILGRLRQLRAVLSALVASCALLASGCGGSSSGGTAAPMESTSSAAAPSTAAIDGTFDVGGHKLYMRCSGQGSPTVIYLHGYIHDPSGGGSDNAGLVPSLLEGEYRVCVYDRANVGLSDQVDGPLTGMDSVQDLHALLKAADLPAPFVLYGGSWGGLIASMYAATYPDEVSGMVLLDPPLPTDNKLEARFLPPGDRLKPSHWRDETEKVDQVTTCNEALELLEGRQDIPVTFLATKDPDLDPSWPVEDMTAAIYQYRQDFMDRFPRGALVTLDVPHYMESAIPDRIAQEVKKVVAQAS